MTDELRDEIDGIAADVLAEPEAGAQLLANDFAAVVNRAAGRQAITPAMVFAFALGGGRGPGMAWPAGDEFAGPGHRCTYCGARIDVGPDDGWIHDSTGKAECSRVPGDG